MFFLFTFILASGVVYAQATINADAAGGEKSDANKELGARALQIGDKGEDVAALQNILKELGFREGEIDGVFGPLTHGGVQRFQAAHGLKTDGVAAGKTMELLLAVRQEDKLDTMAAAEFSFTPAELDLFARLVHAEAGGEPYLGQVAVAATVLNRLRSPKFPNTLSGVVYQIESGKYQYSPVLDGRINLPAKEPAKKAVREALSGKDPTGGATGFYNPAKTSNYWVRSRPVSARIGSHMFFYY